MPTAATKIEAVNDMLQRAQMSDEERKIEHFSGSPEVSVVFSDGLKGRPKGLKYFFS